ncbi:MAG: hypothetical protein ABSF71_39300, partial [Terriglobia bacterium]
MHSAPGSAGILAMNAGWMSAFNTFCFPAIQTVRNQAGRPTSARSVNRSIRSARTALDGLSDGQLST